MQEGYRPLTHERHVSPQPAQIEEPQTKDRRLTHDRHATGGAVPLQRPQTKENPLTREQYITAPPVQNVRAKALEGLRAKYDVDGRGRTLEELPELLIKSDVKEWNSWREQYPEVQVSLRGAQLNGRNLREANLSGVDLGERELCSKEPIWKKPTCTKLT